MNRTERTQYIKRLAGEFGFAACGIARVERLTDDASRLEKWLAGDFHGQMNYMADQFDLRVDPRRLLPEAKSVISLAYNYYPEEKNEIVDSFRVSMYARGRDYHKVLRKKLKSMTRRIRDEIGDAAMRICVDSAPIMEKVWAMRAGLGWIGKNGNLPASRRGSYFFLVELLTDLELEYDRAATDHCGRCRRCIDACPTGAIVEPYVIDSRRCISYLTIEYKGDLPPEVAGSYTDWIFGCDICQQVCPFNRFAAVHDEKDFDPHPDLLTLTRRQWRTLSKEQYDGLFGGSAVERAGYEGLMRNIRFIDR